MALPETLEKPLRGAITVGGFGVAIATSGRAVTTLVDAVFSRDFDFSRGRHHDRRRPHLHDPRSIPSFCFLIDGDSAPG